MKSHIEENLDKKLLKMLNGKSLEAAEILIKDKEIEHLQDYANNVSIKRLDFNDHGPVHMRKTAINAIKMSKILHDAKIKLNLENEGVGSFEDSCVAILLASFLHDIGMTVGRNNHENYSVILAIPIIERILKEVYNNSLEKQIIIRSLALEGITGHMGTNLIHSLEAGIIPIADGCDMEKGRARIPMILNTEAKVGDIHKYSASEINKVKILKGEKRPIRILVEMNASVGFFQVEEVLFRKINASPIKSYIELYAGVIDKELKCYLG